jgi:O-antigen/teichoic acid export membrane protein
MAELPVIPEQENIESRKKTNFSTDILKLVSGTTVAQIVGILASPFLARLFSPDAFGVFALFSSIVGVIAAVFTLQYELAIMLPKDDVDAANLFAGSLGIATLLSFLMIPIVWLWGPSIAGWLNAPALAQYLWLAPILLFFGGIGAGHPVLNAWASRARHFSQISITQVTSTATSTLGTLALGFSGFNSGGGLIVGNLLGSIVSPLLIGSQIWMQNQRLFLASIRFPVIWQNLKRYRKFALYSTPSALLNTVSWQVPAFLLSFFFSPAVVGYYTFGNQLLRLPMNLIGGSIGQAFYSHASVAYHEGTLAVFVENTFRRLVDYSFFPVLMLAVIGKELFLVVFGAQWAEAGVYTQILSLWMIFWFISSPMSRLYSVLEKNELSFWLNAVVLVTRVISIWLGGILGSPRLALLFFSISGAVVYGFLSGSIIFFSGVPWRKIASIVFENIALFALAGGALLLLKLIHIADWLQLIVAAFFIGIYFVYRLKDNKDIKQFLVKRTSLFTKGINNDKRD